MRARHHLYPAMARFPSTELLRAGFGALTGLMVCVLLVRLFPDPLGVHMALGAPLGAAAVLLFCVPNSPLAQPWSVVVGTVISALVAFAAIRFIPAPWMIGGALGGAISAMMLLRALHPPGGALALVMALDPEPVLAQGMVHAVVPITVLSIALMLVAMVYNRITGRIYPFRQAGGEDGDARRLRLGLSNAQLDELLTRFNQSTNLGVADLGRLLAAAESEAAQHRFDGATCGEVMTGAPVTAHPDTRLAGMVKLFQTHAIKTLPVVNAESALQGIVFQADLLAIVSANRPVPWRRKAQPAAADVMRAAGEPVPHDLPVGALINRLAVQGSEVVPVTREGKLVGILTRSDIIRLLLRGADERRDGPVN